LSPIPTEVKLRVKEMDGTTVYSDSKIVSANSNAKDPKLVKFNWDIPETISGNRILSV